MFMYQYKDIRRRHVRLLYYLVNQFSTFVCLLLVVSLYKKENDQVSFVNFIDDDGDSR